MLRIRGFASPPPESLDGGGEGRIHFVGAPPFSRGAPRAGPTRVCGLLRFKGDRVSATQRLGYPTGWRRNAMRQPLPRAKSRKISRRCDCSRPMLRSTKGCYCQITGIQGWSDIGSVISDFSWRQLRIVAGVEHSRVVATSKYKSQK